MCKFSESTLQEEPVRIILIGAPKAVKIVIDMLQYWRIV